MMKRRGGAIVNISSIVGLRGNWGQTNYSASKAGIIGFTKSLARELGSRGVRANVVAPGYVKTRLTDEPPGPRSHARQYAARPLGRSGGRRRSWRFLCSDEASFITGEVLLVDGAGNVTNGSLNGRRRVVVTGMRAVTPLGNDVESTWDNLVAGEIRCGGHRTVGRQRVPGQLRAS